ncbi:GH15 family glucan-1,4-alpha-glucosidase [Hamadaea flava]|uniref:Glycoside hydrolase family 15 protein n=1 Tax=Hamadaea flava TaxID=1742688 RepID=A0ABV8LGF3_9ACTN|nr:glycoside hydrolase family 15 protein [Hamadaea flava]MCP2324272.1 GH15 family glucan-1,4-alpha-glucosidase [Hamadaea flava]
MAADSGRIDGYAALRDYAVVGDGRTAALIAPDGAVDWLSWPDLDSPSVFGAILDAERGGSFQLRPETSFSVGRNYRPGTNVLETTFTTESGTVVVTDALTLQDDHPLGPARELVRQITCVAGTVPIEWTVEPRFSYASAAPRVHARANALIASHHGQALAVSAWGAGTPRHTDGTIHGRADLTPGPGAMIALSYADLEPLVLPTRGECEDRLVRTEQVWREWAGQRPYDGPWRDAVLRSALALKLLVFAPSAAVAAAATCSLPELIGGERNWDYRFSWIRDSVFTLNAFLQLDCPDEAIAYFWWLMHASQLTHPRLRVLYRLDGGPHAGERTLPLSGYRRSRPVRVGNAAAGQLQLDTYGELLQTARRYATRIGRLDADIGRRLAQIADLVCQVWRQPDAGIWEVRSAPQHFTQSKMMCWVALDAAVELALAGLIPNRRLEKWLAERAAVAQFIDSECFDTRRGSYVRSAGSADLDAGVLLGLLNGFRPAEPSRLAGTVHAVQRELRHGPYVYRYLSEDGVRGGEGAFLACSFWLAEALARFGRPDEAVPLMDELVGLANDVGLYSEEIDPGTGAFLGNLPQGLSHLALISAAGAIADAMHGDAG